MSDLISRQAAIDALAKAMPSLTTPDGCGEFDHEIQIAQEAFVDAMQIIHELPSAQPEQRWIPCSERLPEEGEDIIVTYVDDEETRIIPVNYDKGTWYDCIFDTALNPIKVIAWMPLPTPYKAEGSEE